MNKALLPAAVAAQSATPSSWTRAAIVLVAAFAVLWSSPVALAQHSVREDFPNGSERGERFDPFTKTQWAASNY